MGRSANERAKPKRKETLRRIYQLFPVLEERKYRKAETLSGGEQQMLSIGRGLMALPRLLVFDEPSYDSTVLEGSEKELLENEHIKKPILVFEKKSNF